MKFYCISYELEQQTYHLEEVEADNPNFECSITFMDDSNKRVWAASKTSYKDALRLIKREIETAGYLLHNAYNDTVEENVETLMERLRLQQQELDS